MALSSPLGAATVENIIAAIGGGRPPSDPLQAGILNLTPSLNKVVIGPSGDLYWTTGVQVIRRLANGTRVVVAGQDGAGNSGLGGLATAAVITTGGGLAFNASGDLFLTSGSQVLTISSSTGIITSIAGTGTSGYAGDGGVATSAQLNAPLGLAFNAAGDLFIADLGNNRVRRIAAGTGIITTYAGTGVAGSSGDGALASLAQVNNPRGLAIDLAGNLYIADNGNFRIRRVDAVSKNITTVAGNGSGSPVTDGVVATASSLPAPMDVVVDAAGNLSLSSWSSNCIYKVTQATGLISTIIGPNVGFSGDNGPAATALIDFPNGLTVDASGNLFFCDTRNHRIREIFASSHNVVTVAGNGSANFSGDGVQALAATLASPSGIIFDASDNRYIVDQNNNRIRKVVKATGIITTIAGTGDFGFSGDGGQATLAMLAKPSGIALDPAGNLLIADQYNHRLRKVTMATGVITTIAGTGPASEVSLGTHQGDGGLATAAHLNQPENMAIAPNGDIYCSDIINECIYKITASTGIITVIAGDGTTRTTPGFGVYGYSGDGGPASSAKLFAPTCLRLDAAGNLYVADCNNGRIRKIAASDGTITTIAGGGSSSPNAGDGGAATSANILQPTSMVFDSVGNLFIPDQGHSRVRRVDHVTGIITTVAGTGVPGYSGDDGPAIAAQLYFPTGVAFDNGGHLFITDRYVNVIRELITVTVPVITWTPQSLVYGVGLGANQFNASTTVAGSFAYANVAGTVLPVGSPSLQATFTPSDHLTYAMTTVNATVTVTRAGLAVIADNLTKTVGAANPALTYHLGGLVNGDLATVLSAPPTLSTTATTVSPAGTYPIAVDVSGVTTANYTPSATPGTMTVSSAPSSLPPASTSSGGSGGCGLGSGIAALLVFALMLGARLKKDQRR